MSITAQVTMKFNHTVAEYGVSEVYYMTAPTVEVAASIGAGALWTARKQFMDPKMYLVEVVASDVAVQRDSKTLSPNSSGGGSPSQQYTDPTTVLLLRKEATTKYRGRIYLHAVGRQVFFGDGTYNAGNPFDASIQTFANFLKTPTAGISFNLRVKNPAGPPEFLYVQLSDAFVQRRSSHRVGKPFGLAVGKRRIA